MSSKVPMVLGIILILALLAIIIDSDPSIDTASVYGQVKCISAESAANAIEENGCIRIYEDAECAEKGLVEIRCP